MVFRKEIEGSYWCYRCGAVDRAIEVYDDECNGREILCLCGDDVEEAESCPCCGAAVNPFKWPWEQFPLCEPCLEEMDKATSSLIDEIKGRMTRNEAIEMLSYRLEEL